MANMLYDKENKEWIELERGEQKDNKATMSIDRLLMNKLDLVKKDLGDDDDVACLVCGATGSGKSNAARILARYVSNEHFDPRTHIVSEPEDIPRVFRKAKKGEAVIFDEGSGIFAATDAMTKKSKDANYILDICRQQNLFLIILAPAFHRLGGAVAIDRTKFLIRIFKHKKTGQKGRFKYYNADMKEKVYRYAKKNFGSILRMKTAVKGTFGLDKTFLDSYRKVKDLGYQKALERFESGQKKRPSLQEIKREAMIDIVRNNMDKPVKVMMDLLGKGSASIQRYRREVTEKHEEQLINGQFSRKINQSAIIPNKTYIKSVNEVALTPTLSSNKKVNNVGLNTTTETNND